MNLSSEDITKIAEAVADIIEARQAEKKRVQAHAARDFMWGVLRMETEEALANTKLRPDGPWETLKKKIGKK